MKKNDLKIKAGDKVVCDSFLEELIHPYLKGKTGTVINVRRVVHPLNEEKDYLVCGVEFDKKVSFCKHNDASEKSINAKSKLIDGKEKGKMGYCYNFLIEDVKKVEIKNVDDVYITLENKDVIYHKNGEEWKATCGKGDKFDLEKGVMLAMLRSFGVEYKDIERLCKSCDKKKKVSASEEIDEVFDLVKEFARQFIKPKNVSDEQFEKDYERARKKTDEEITKLTGLKKGDK